MPIDNDLYDRTSETWWADAGFPNILQTALNPVRVPFLERQLRARFPTHSNNHSLSPHWLRTIRHERENRATRQPTRYGLTLVLAGITADDYLQRIRDPEPPAGPELKLISAQPAPTGNRIELELLTHGKPPANRDAAIAVGFPITPEVIGIHRTPLPA